MRTMYDATNPAGLPSGGDLYAGYIDGRWPWAKNIHGTYLGKQLVRIATTPHTEDGDVGDSEDGNGTVTEWADWVVARRAAGADPSLYLPLSRWSAQRAVFGVRRIPEPHWWVAHWGVAATPLPQGAVALQFNSFNAYDVSSVADYWPGVDAAPSEVPSIKGKEDTMLIVRAPNGAAYAVAGAKRVPLTTGDEVNGAIAAGVPVWQFAKQEEFTAFVAGLDG